MTEKGKDIVIDLDDEVLVGSNNMDSTEHVISSEDDVVVGDGVNVPEVGMKFNNEKELFEFYKRYAYDVGFPVRKRNSKTGHDVPVVETQVLMPPPTSFPQLVMGAQGSHAITQSFTCTNVGPMSSSHVGVNFQGNAIPYYYPHVAYQAGTNLGYDDGSQYPVADDDVRI